MAGIDRIDLALESTRTKIFEYAAAKRARPVRRADERDGLRHQQRIEVMLHERFAKDPTGVSESTSPGTLPKAWTRINPQNRGGAYPGGGIICS